MSEQVRVRFAPSPTGHLHVGGARTALFNWLFAKHHGGSFVLRIEDTDTARSTREAEAAVLEDLAWLGLDWDEGPDVGGDYGPYRQSERLEIYREHVEILLAEGKAFRCYCTDDELAAKRKVALASGRAPHYDGTCRNLTEAERRAREAEGRAPSVRLLGPARDVVVDDLVRGRVTFAKDMVGDFVIMRSNGRPTYNFAVVVDDALMRVTHVIRAEEHLPNTMRQLLVYEALGFAPPSFAHVSLIVDKDRSKLSKRRGAVSVAEFREQGYLPDALVNYLALLGWSPLDGEEFRSRESLIEEFDLARVSSSPAAFDEDKLKWLNARRIREEPIGSLVRAARPFLSARGMSEPDDARIGRMLELVRGGVTTLAELPDAIAFFFDDGLMFETEAERVLADGAARSVLEALRNAMEEDGFSLTSEGFKDVLRDLAESLGLGNRRVFMAVRAALTGRTHGPPIGDVAALLGRERVLTRLSAVLSR